MLHLLLDENLDRRILRGLKLRISQLDCLTVQEINLRGVSDPLILAWAAEQQRVLVTHDVNTIPRYAYERINAEEGMTGVMVIPEDLAIGTAIEELAIVIECCEMDEFINQVRYLPI
jgi:hypothetical protein